MPSYRVAADLNARHRPGDGDEWTPFRFPEAAVTRH